MNLNEWLEPLVKYIETNLRVFQTVVEILQLENDSSQLDWLNDPMGCSEYIFRDTYESCTEDIFCCHMCSTEYAIIEDCLGHILDHWIEEH